MLSTKDCENCGRTFIDWDDRTADDVIAGPYVLSSGDLMCMSCGPQNDRERERAAEGEYAYPGDYGDDY